MARLETGGNLFRVKKAWWVNEWRGEGKSERDRRGLET
jgi:hypothetical protein